MKESVITCLLVNKSGVTKQIPVVTKCSHRVIIENSLWW